MKLSTSLILLVSFLILESRAFVHLNIRRNNIALQKFRFSKTSLAAQISAEPKTLEDYNRAIKNFHQRLPQSKIYFQKAQQYFDRMVGVDQIKPNLATFHALMDVHQAAGQYEQVYNILQFMEAVYSVEPDRVCYEKVLEVCNACRNWKTVIELLEIISYKKVHTISYRYFMPIYRHVIGSQNNHVHRIFLVRLAEYFSEQVEQNENVSLVSSVVSQAENSSQKFLAEVIISTLKFHILVGDLQKADDVFIKYGNHIGSTYVVRRIGLSILKSHLIKNVSIFQKKNQLFVSNVKRLNPNVDYFNQVLGLLFDQVQVQAGILDRLCRIAFDIFTNQLKAYNVTADTSTCNILFNFCAANYMPKKALEVYHYIQDNHVVLSGNCIASAMMVLSKTSHLSAVISLYLHPNCLPSHEVTSVLRLLKCARLSNNLYVAELIYNASTVSELKYNLKRLQSSLSLNGSFGDNARLATMSETSFITASTSPKPFLLNKIHTVNSEGGTEDISDLKFRSVFIYNMIHVYSKCGRIQQAVAMFRDKYPQLKTQPRSSMMVQVILYSLQNHFSNSKKKSSGSAGGVRNSYMESFTSDPLFLFAVDVARDHLESSPKFLSLSYDMDIFKSAIWLLSQSNIETNTDILIRTLVRMLGNHPNEKYWSDALLNTCDGLIARGHSDALIKLVKQCQSANPASVYPFLSSPKYLLSLLDAFIHTGDIDACFKLLLKAIKLDMSLSMKQLTKLHMICRKSDKYEKMKPSLEQLISSYKKRVRSAQNRMQTNKVGKAGRKKVVDVVVQQSISASHFNSVEEKIPSSNSDQSTSELSEMPLQIPPHTELHTAAISKTSSSIEDESIKKERVNVEEGSEKAIPSQRRSLFRIIAGSISKRLRKEKHI